MKTLSPAASAAAQLFSVCETPAALAQACLSLTGDEGGGVHVQMFCHQGEAERVFCMLHFHRPRQPYAWPSDGQDSCRTRHELVAIPAHFRCQGRPAGRLVLSSCDACRFESGAGAGVLKNNSEGAS